MGGAPRFLALLSPPPALRLFHRPTLLRLAGHHQKHRLSRAATARHSPRLFPFSPCLTRTVFPAAPLRTRRELHTQAQLAPEPPTRLSHPWPEWSGLMESLSGLGYFDSSPSLDAQNDVVPGFPEELLRPAFSCMDFARDHADLLGMLPRREIEVVAQNTSPHLFKSGEDSAMRMRWYLGGGFNNALDTDKASTADLMRFIVSYIGSLAFDGSNQYNRELVDPSVRNLLSELSKLSYGMSEANLSRPVPNKFSDSHGQATRSFGQKIEMKRGDWICPRCNFMNFARNVKCLECEETRPKRQLTGGEWECPQCDFFNYGRNATCLRCDCERPGNVSIGSINLRTGLAFDSNNSFNNPDYDSRLAANEEKAQRWFSKISQLDSTSDMSSAISDEDFPEIMPLRKGVNRFVVSTRKTPLERRVANAGTQRTSGKSDGENRMCGPNKPLDTKISRTLDEILGRSSTASESSNTFSENPNMASGDDSSDQRNGLSVGSSRQLNDEAENNDTEKEQGEKSERWFKKVAELHNVTDLASAVSDEDFPEIMPMRKGENRFVVSRKKDRSLSSPAYKRRMAMQQLGNSKFVPFVPFPPDYFAKKDNQQPSGSESTSGTNKETAKSMTAENPGNAREEFTLVEGLERMTGQQMNMESQDRVYSTKSNIEENKAASIGTYGLENTRCSEDGVQQTSHDISTGNWKQRSPYWSSSNTQTSNKNSDNMNRNDAGSSVGSSQPSGDVRNGWSGKSLEGSAVKEPDPLDMSEEAKAERWFKRVAQIKDISELSQIPDEDFPSIMPMRKGVNRFVVSKRKTPLERRLTNQQSRRSLPTVPSDPFKRGNGSSS